MAIQDSFINSAQATTTFGKGFSDALAALAQQETSEQQAFLQQFNTPQEAMQQLEQAGVSGLKDVVFGLGGYIPGSTLANEGAAWTAYFGQQPQFTQGMLAQNQPLLDQQLAIQQQEMMNQMSKAQMDMQVSAAESAARISSQQAEAAGLTAAQQESKRQFDVSFAREEQWRAEDIAREGQLREDELAAAHADEVQQARAIEEWLVSTGTPRKIAHNMAFAGISESLAGQFADIQQGAAETQQTAIETRNANRTELLATMTSWDFKQGQTKQAVINGIFGVMKGIRPNLYGMDPKNVRQKIKNFVNESWPAWQQGEPAAPPGQGPRGPSDASINSAFEGGFEKWEKWYAAPSAISSTPIKPPQAQQAPPGMWFKAVVQRDTAAPGAGTYQWRISYRFAFNRQMAALKAKHPQWVRKNPKLAKRRVNQYLRSLGIKPYKKPPK